MTDDNNIGGTRQNADELEGDASTMVGGDETAEFGQELGWASPDDGADVTADSKSGGAEGGSTADKNENA